MSESRDEWFRFLRWYTKLGPSDESTIRLFERVDRNKRDNDNGDAKFDYYAYGSDAEWIAANTLRGNSALKSTDMSSTKLSYCKVLPASIREASEVQKLEIWSRSSGGTGEWRISRTTSPGNRDAIEDITSVPSSSDQVSISVRVSVKNNERTVGVCYINYEAMEIGVAEFADDEFYTNLRSIAIQTGASEMIIPRIGEGDKKNLELEKIQSIMMKGDDNLGILVTEVKPSDFNETSAEEDLTRLLRESNVSIKALPQFEFKKAMGACCALISYLELLTKPELYNRFSLIQIDLDEYMRLDASALRALNLMPGPRDGSKTMSVYGVLNHCKTAGGSRMLSRWLRQPLMKIEEIQSRHDLVELFVNNNLLRMELQEKRLKIVPDLNKLQRKLQKNGRDALEDLIRIYQLIIELPAFIQDLTDVDPLLTSTYTTGIMECYEHLVNLQTLVEETIDLDALERHEFRIKPDFDEELKAIKTELDTLEASINEAYAEANIDLGIEAEKLKLERHHVYGWCFRLTRTNAGILKGKSKYILCANGGMSKAGQFFRTKDIARYDIEYRKHEEKYKRIQSQLSKKIIGIAATYHEVIGTLGYLLSHLDVIVSFSHVASYSLASYVRPKMHPAGTGNTILKEARHPCMEVQDGIEFIANDVNMIRGESDFLIITGPNMGGKSTYIRQIGVIALMAQIGSFVPCSEAELSIYDSILARVGAGDSQLKGVSTFMAEMLETATILRSATAKSLIVIDELGRGTSTYDGFGLAWAISEHIVKNIGCMAMFATHFHELTSLADNHPNVCNLHVLAHVSEEKGSTTNDKEVILQYKIEPGVSDQSFGIHVAKMANFPAKVLNMAKRKAMELEDFEGDNEEVVSKRVHKKYTNEEIHVGNSLLRNLLHTWSKKVDVKQDNPELMIEKLQATVQDAEYRDQIAGNAYIQELMAEL